jgi:hypothetical protein
MNDSLEQTLERIRKDQPSSDDHLEDYRRRRREYEEARGNKPEPKASWRKSESSRQHSI